MNSFIAAIIALASLVVVGGVFATRYWRTRADGAAVRARLESMFAAVENVDTIAVAPEATKSNVVLKKIAKLIDTAGVPFSATELLASSIALPVGLCAIAVMLGLPLMIAVAVCALFIAAPYFALTVMSNARRDKFVQQLPDAIDLMISVLRSGLSIQHAIKSAAEEIPSPCGPEFVEVLHRINLGQSLSEALAATVERYDLFELELLRRATAIQQELGGSLAELLDKTNKTLRQRIRLKHQVRVLTAQSRLSGLIISLLPFVVAIGFYFLNKEYLRPLYETNIGRLFVVAALGFQIMGIVIIRRLATFRV